MVPGLLRPAEVATQERNIPPVAFERRIKNIADERHRSEHSIHDDVAGHPRQDYLRRPQAMTLPEHPEGDCRGGRVANTGNETDDAVQSKPPAGSRNAKARVQEVRKRVKPLQSRLVDVEARPGLQGLPLLLRVEDGRSRRPPESELSDPAPSLGDDLNRMDDARMWPRMLAG